MKFLAFVIPIFLCACNHTERKIEFVDVKIRDSATNIKLAEVLHVEQKLPQLVLPEIDYRYKNYIQSYWSCGFSQPENHLADLSLNELQKSYGALVVTNSYKKWIPIEGEPETVFVFNFEK